MFKLKLINIQVISTTSFDIFQKMDALDMESTKYSEDTQKLGIVHYESRLSVFNVTKADYDVYNCKATNELGVDESPVRLDGTSKLK